MATNSVCAQMGRISARRFEAALTRAEALGEVALGCVFDAVTNTIPVEVERVPLGPATIVVIVMGPRAAFEDGARLDGVREELVEDVLLCELLRAGEFREERKVEDADEGADERSELLADEACIVEAEDTAEDMLCYSLVSGRIVFRSSQRTQSWLPETQQTDCLGKNH
ncbi:hypothetical protein PYCC9005_006046 [Savitreella phatthalungensis]